MNRPTRWDVAAGILITLFSFVIGYGIIAIFR